MRDVFNEEDQLRRDRMKNIEEVATETEEEWLIKVSKLKTWKSEIIDVLKQKVGLTYENVKSMLALPEEDGIAEYREAEKLKDEEKFVKMLQKNQERNRRSSAGMMGGLLFLDDKSNSSIIKLTGPDNNGDIRSPHGENDNKKSQFLKKSASVVLQPSVTNELNKKEKEIIGEKRNNLDPKDSPMATQKARLSDLPDPFVNYTKPKINTPDNTK